MHSREGRAVLGPVGQLGSGFAWGQRGRKLPARGPRVHVDATAGRPGPLPCGVCVLGLCSMGPTRHLAQ